MTPFGMGRLSYEIGGKDEEQYSISHQFIFATCKAL